MRTIVEIPDHDIQGLDMLCGREHISRAEAIRRAVAGYLKVNQGDADVAFGLWQGRGIDALSYQNDIRDEWPMPTVHEPGQSQHERFPG